MSRALITEDFLNRSGKRMDELYEKSMMCKEWVLHSVNNVGTARVIWSQMEPYKITVCAFSINRNNDNGEIIDRSARIIGVKYVDDIVTVLRFCGYDDVADKILTDKI